MYTQVEYNVRSFLEKNRDTINESLKTVLNGSEQMLMRKLLISRRFTCFTCFTCLLVLTAPTCASSSSAGDLLALLAY